MPEATSVSNKRNTIPGGGKLLLLSSLVNNMGNGMYLIALGKLLFDETGSAKDLGIILVLEQILTFIIHVVAGPLIDRYNPKTFYVRVELLRGTLVLILSLLLNESNPMPWIMAITFFIQIGKPVNRGAFFALPPSIVPEQTLHRYNSFSNTFLQTGALCGTLVAGPLLALSGPKLCFVINAISFLLAAIFVHFVRYDHHGEAKPQLHSNWILTIRFVLVAAWGEFSILLKKTSSLFWHLILSSADFLVISIFTLLLAPIAAYLFNGSPVWMCLLDAAFTVGAILGAPISDWMERRLPFARAVVVGFASQSVLFFVFCFISGPALWLISCMMLGLANTISWAALLTTLQRRTPKSARGRMGTVRHIFVAAITALFIPCVGKAEAISLGTAFLSCGLIFFGFTVLVLCLSTKWLFGDGLLGSNDAG